MATRKNASGMKSLASLCLSIPVEALLPQAQPDSRRRAAFGSVRCAAAWAEDRDQRLVGIAAHRPIGLHRAQVCGGIALIAAVAFLALLTGRTLRPLWSLRPLRALCTGHTLNALRPLGSCRPLWAGVTFRTGLAAARGQRKRQCDRDRQKQPHIAPIPNVTSDFPILLQTK